MTDRIAYRRETTFGTNPSVGSLRSRNVRISTVGKREILGYVRFACPACGGDVDSTNAPIRSEIPGGIRWQSVPCTSCDKTYTVDIVDVCIVYPPRAGTGLRHAAIGAGKTLCGLNPDGWYTDKFESAADIGCKRCRAAWERSMAPQEDGK